MVSAMRQCAWLWNPSSLARSARRLTIAVMVALVSFASPLSPRLLNFLQTISRRSRRGEDVRNGSTLERVLMIASCRHSTSVEVFSSARTFARNSANRARQLLVDFGQPLLLRRVQLRAAAHEVLVHARDETHLIGLELRSRQRVVHGFDPLEESLIEHDGVSRRRQLRLPLALERLIRGLVTLSRATPNMRSTRSSVQPGALHGGDRVVERRRLAVRHDGVDLAALFRDRRFEGAGEMLGRHAIPGRHAAVRARPWRD